jgi:HSP20 family molecular chaperone IbpA
VLPEPVDPEHARAEYRRGLLMVSLPVAPREPTAERVVIQVGRDG